MKLVCIVTFIHGQEVFNETFITLCKCMADAGFTVDPLVLCDHKISIAGPCRCIELGETTKYARILFAIRNSEADIILFVDNDITPDPDAIIRFAESCLENDCAAGWGKIDSLRLPGLVPGLVRADKRISHDFIRPFLWKTGAGISIPGQIFLLKREIMNTCLDPQDTVFDDLSIGVAVKMNRLKIYAANQILGYERPNITLAGLIKQRKRWAKGFGQIIFFHRKSPVLPYVLIHGFMYHFLWIPLGVIMLDLLYFWSLPGLALLLLSIFWMARFSMREIYYAAAYLVVFPFIHCIWMKTLVHELRELHSMKHRMS